MTWNFVRFHKILIETNAKIFSFLSWQTNKNIYKKNMKCTAGQDSYFWNRQMPYCLATLQVYMALVITLSILVQICPKGKITKVQKLFYFVFQVFFNLKMFFVNLPVFQNAAFSHRIINHKSNNTYVKLSAIIIYH